MKPLFIALPKFTDSLRHTIASTVTKRWERDFDGLEKYELQLLFFELRDVPPSLPITLPPSLARLLPPNESPPNPYSLTEM